MFDDGEQRITARRGGRTLLDHVPTRRIAIANFGDRRIALSAKEKRNYVSGLPDGEHVAAVNHVVAVQECHRGIGQQPLGNRLLAIAGLHQFAAQ